MLAYSTPLLLSTVIATAAVDVAGDSLAASKFGCDSSYFSYSTVDGATMTSLSAALQTKYLTPSSDIFPSFTNLNFCEVNIHITHADADDDVLVRAWLPSPRDDWNKRFQATGGGGFATSLGFLGLAPAVRQGYAAVSTDGGHDEWSCTSLKWLFNTDRSIKWDLWHNFVQRSVVEQILIGKDIVEQYYGQRPQYSYWSGCSQGGRQGYMLAQRFPKLLDGIMAVAPALDLVSISMGDFWPQLVIRGQHLHVAVRFRILYNEDDGSL